MALFSTLAGLIYGAWIDGASVGLISVYLVTFLATLAGLLWLVKHLGVEAQIVKITDYADIMKYNVLSTPGLVINKKLVSTGRIPSEAEIATFLANAL